MFLEGTAVAFVAATAIATSPAIVHEPAPEPAPVVAPAYTVTTEDCFIYVEADEATHILIDATVPGIVAPTMEQQATYDSFARVGSLHLQPGEWNYTVVVIVNNFSEVSQQRGHTVCR